MRSVAGCLTCRRRKLKCDEQKPICGQCRKVRRDCQPSKIIFRHQYNSSVEQYESNSDGNPEETHTQETRFSEDIWSRPKSLRFIHEISEGQIQASRSLRESQDLNRPEQAELLLGGGSELAINFQHSDGLEDSFGDATANSNPFLPHELVMDHEVTSPNSDQRQISERDLVSTMNTTEVPASLSDSEPLPAPSDYLSFILNPSAANFSPHTPESLDGVQSGCVPDTSHYVPFPTLPLTEPRLETNPEIAFLLRHFSEGPGKWMDLYDLGFYFSIDVPIRALSTPLLKAAVCAYTAKYLSRVNVNSKAGPPSSPPSTTMWPEADQVDWAVLGARYYASAINLLRETLKEPHLLSFSNNPSPRDQETSNDVNMTAYGCGQIESAATSEPQISTTGLDEVLAATAILCVYEHISASELAWSGHLSGTRMLLNLAKFGLMPSTMGSEHTDGIRPSKARKSIFWNFVRQDFLAAFITGSQTRINTEDLRIWKDAGLPLDSNGNIVLRPGLESDYPTSDNTVKDDTISNTLIWLLAKVVNFVSANKSFQSWQAGRNSETNAEESEISQTTKETLLGRWASLSNELNTWFGGLPPSFRPCARIERVHDISGQSNGNRTPPFPEIWFSNVMCASTIQNYHMARILLLIHNPNAPTAYNTTVSSFLKFYRSTEVEIRRRCQDVCGIALTYKSASMYVHQCQLLFVVGQCLSDQNERQFIVDLLRRLRSDYGWETEYRVQQLFAEWGWEARSNIQTPVEGGRFPT